MHFECSMFIVGALYELFRHNVDKVGTMKATCMLYYSRLVCSTILL